MNKSLPYLLVLTSILLLMATDTTAQNKYTDSLYQRISGLDDGHRQKPVLLSKLANIVRYYDEKEALRLASEAVMLADRAGDPVLQTYAYESRSAVYLRMGETGKAHKDTEQSILFAEKSKDPKVLSWAWYRRGRELDFENHPKEAVTAQLKALSLIREKNYWTEEASIYYALYGIFSSWEDISNESKYAQLALEAAQKSGNPNNRCESWQAIASAAHDRYLKTGEKDRALLDSSMNAYRNAILIYQQHAGYMEMVQLITIPCINLADIYNRHFPPSKQTTDSLRHYAMLGFDYATKGKDKRLQAAAFGLMNEDAKRNGNYALAETYLTQALTLFAGAPAPDYYIRSNVYRDLAELAERRNDYRLALQYQKAYLADYQKVFDAEQNAAGKKLEAQYQDKEKEQQITFLKERERLHRRQKYLYAGAGIALLLGLLFMFRSYHFRLRYSLQREQLLKKEKEEAHLLAQLKAEENLLLDAQKRNAELNNQLQAEQLKLKAEEAARLHTEQQVMLAQKEVLQKEVLAGRLQVEQKNKILYNLRDRLLDGSRSHIREVELNKLMKEQVRIDNDFEEIKTDLKEVHPDFYKKLQQKAPQKLTDLDLKYCAYILLKRNNKEMSVLLGVEPKSIRMSKYRLKQKLGLEKEEDLEAYIRSLA